MFNTVIQGWINYYGRFYKSMLYPVFRHLNEILVRWAMRKYKRLRFHRQRPGVVQTAEQLYAGDAVVVLRQELDGKRYIGRGERVGLRFENALDRGFWQTRRNFPRACLAKVREALP